MFYKYIYKLTWLQCNNHLIYPNNVHPGKGVLCHGSVPAISAFYPSLIPSLCLSSWLGFELMWRTVSPLHLTQSGRLVVDNLQGAWTETIKSMTGGNPMQSHLLWYKNKRMLEIFKRSGSINGEMLTWTSLQVLPDQWTFLVLSLGTLFYSFVFAPNQKQSRINTRTYTQLIFSQS